MVKKVVVVGNGMVGHKFVANLFSHQDASEYEIRVLADEKHIAYDRVQLSSYFSGATKEDLLLTSEQEYQDNDVLYTLGNKVQAIDVDNKSVLTEQGQTYEYDKLVLATGSFPFVPPVPGKDQPHCLVYRTLDDLEAIKASATDSKVGVVVGGGLLGLEAANALKNLGLESHVVEFAPNLMGVQLDDDGSALLRSKIEELGVGVHTSKNTKEIVAGEQCRYRMNFADDTYLETDMIVFSAGIRPQDELARQTGLEVGERGGIVVDNVCLTSNKDIYAIGECALWGGRIFGLVAPGYTMAQVAVSHLTGGDETFEGADMSTKLKLLGVDVASIGDAHARGEGVKSFVYSDQVTGVYKRLNVTADGKKVAGAVLIGDVDAYGTLLQMMLNDMELPESPEALILPALDGEQVGSGTDMLPDTAQICSCFNVSKGQIVEAVHAGSTDMAAIKSCTGASTGCGGCTVLVKQVLDKELESLGVEVKKDICEHFAYSRAELAEIVRVKQIKTFKELLASHGKGFGCDICKPTVGSILASFWNDHVLDGQHVGLQDTNDIYLGNLQKDGTYSVVPRVAAGEITPDKLIVLGEVAKEFDLYTKITGGQRVDLFGAKVHELPAIWRKLVDAGFETGHAYGKSLRTVKSCVGSTWCRYGVDDSVGLAIDIENRYKGLRSPHKIKMAVSGCTRECAEAQCKDVGVIATENGWNLYVCGNGGMRPRHADLLAQDLDTETLIKYVDRFLMYYIRTADRLQRTSVWLENLEGGLDHVYDVVVNDSLNIAKDLESEMQNTLGKYECEWKATIEDPDKVKRFKTFMNSDESDDRQLYIRERGQKRPVTLEELEKIQSQQKIEISQV